MKLLKTAATWLWHLFTRRAWLKAISIVLALILWAYIVGNNNSITRNKNLTGVSLYNGSTSILTSRSLALATDVMSEYQGAINATVTVPQNRFSIVTPGMVRVTPDYTGIYKAGTYEVPLNAECSYGTVARVSPSTITVVIENLDTREVAINVGFERMDDDYWYSYDSYATNPQSITISGPASLIQSITGVEAIIDVKDRVNGFRRTQPLTLKTAEGALPSSRLLTKSSNSCSAVVEIFPKKALTVKVDESMFNVAPGYQITDISCMPSTVTVAGSSELLDGLDYLPLEIPDKIVNVSKSFNSRLSVGGIDGLRYLSATQVYLTVTVSEIEEQ